MAQQSKWLGKRWPGEVLRRMVSYINPSHRLILIATQGIEPISVSQMSRRLEEPIFFMLISTLVLLMSLPTTVIKFKAVARFLGPTVECSIILLIEARTW